MVRSDDRVRAAKAQPAAATESAEAVADTRRLERLSAYLDGELMPLERRETEAELAASTELRAELERLRCVDALIRRYADTEALSEWAQTLTPSPPLQEKGELEPTPVQGTAGPGRARRVEQRSRSTDHGSRAGRHGADLARSDPTTPEQFKRVPGGTFGRHRTGIAAAVGITLAACAMAVLMLMPDNHVEQPATADSRAAPGGGPVTGERGPRHLIEEGVRLDRVGQAVPSEAEATPPGDGQAIDGLVVATEWVRLLDQSGQSLEAAMHLLEDALVSGSIPPDTWERGRDQYLELLDQLVAVLVELHRCDAAERRLKRAGAADLLPSLDDPVVSELRGVIRGCREEVAAAAPSWDRRAYRRARFDGQRLMEEGLEMPSDSPERVRRLDESLERQLTAIALLVSLRDQVPDQPWWPGPAQDLAMFGHSAALTMLELDLRFLAGVQLEDTLALLAGLPEEVRETLAGTAAQLAAENDASAAGHEVSTVRELLQAQADVDREGERGEPASPPDETGGAAPGEEATPGEAVGPRRRVVVTIQTDPSRVRVYQDGEYVGRTPLAQTLESSQEIAVFTLRKADYETERVAVDLTREEGPVDIVLEMRPVSALRQSNSAAGRP